MLADPLTRLTSALAGRYRVERVLGSGGMATVYLAEDLKHHRKVAIKVLEPELAAAVGAERFLREVEIAASLNYPHIVPLFDSGEADGFLFYVMPYIEGESLRDRLRREGQLPVDAAVAIAQQVARALTHAASHGIVHRDIKPENILLVEDHALVADFGIARAIAASDARHLTQTGVAIGTPAYISPEQATAERDIDARSDVYALGCVLYEMLAGQPPYVGPTAQAIVAQHLTSPVPEIRRLRATVPDHVDRAITRALAKLRADRFSTAHDFGAALTSPTLAERRTTPAPGDTKAPGDARPRRMVGAAAVGAVAVAIALFAFNVAGLRDRLTGTSASVERGRSIAVLPFDNVGGSDEEYFSDGLTEELIAALAQLRSLRVAARTSSFAFKGQARDIRSIARALNVSTVLVGSVRKAENRVRVTAQLVDGTSGLDIWSEAYEERDLSNIFDIQTDVALRIARALEANLSDEERLRLARKPTENLEAYTLYLKGRYFWGRRGEGLTTAIEYFNRAIAVDSQYARAYAGLASVYGPLGVLGYIVPRDGRERMKQAAQRAVDLDDQLAEAHTALGAYFHVYEWDWASAEREFQRAIQLDPNFPTAHFWYGHFLESMGRYEAAVAERSRARELDPLAPSGSSGLATSLTIAHRDGRAKSLYRDALELDPNFWQAYDGLGIILELTGELDEARRAFESALAASGRSPRARVGLARVLARLKRTGEARTLLDELRAQSAATGIRHPLVATVYFALGDVNGAIEWLEGAYQQRHPDLVRLVAEPGYDAMRSEPRFQAMIRRVGLPG